MIHKGWQLLTYPACLLKNIKLLLTAQTIAVFFLLNNQPDALIIQIYSVIKLYMFRGIFSAHHQEFSTVHSTIGKFHAGF